MNIKKYHTHKEPVCVWCMVWYHIYIIKYVYYVDTDYIILQL